MADGSDGGTRREKRDEDRIVFGNRHAGILCNLSHEARLDLIAEGLPIILASARGFREAARALADHPREARVLSGFCDEECAKIFILMDLVRCPRRIAASRVGKLVRIFYDHLGRLIYTDAQYWHATDIRELRGYVDNARGGHYLEGNFGEYIMPNSSRYTRESAIYADIEVHEDGKPMWNDPMVYKAIGGVLAPLPLRLAEAMDTAGLFNRRGLAALNDVWDQVEFEDEADFGDTRRLTDELFERLEREGIADRGAIEQSAGALAHDWQMPMYNLEFRELPVALSALRAQQEALYWAEVGDDSRDY